MTNHDELFTILYGPLARFVEYQRGARPGSAGVCVVLWPNRLTVQLHRCPTGPRLVILAAQTPEEVRRFISQRIAEGVSVEIASGVHV